MVREWRATPRADSLVCGVVPLDTLPSRVIGAKPAEVCRWIFTLLSAGPGDLFGDLFPGSGAVGRAWAAYTSQEPSSPPAPHASCKAPGRRIVPGRDAAVPPRDVQPGKREVMTGYRDRVGDQLAQHGVQPAGDRGAGPAQVPVPLGPDLPPAA